jgi:hypothetical protein
MSVDPSRSDAPRENMHESAKNLVMIWSSMAEVAADIANAKRSIFLAYVAEGFSESQALELVKTI